ncbi:MAG TPA: SDR family NAD(P)-dependent oxidoreductase [Acidimicrobiales bacterium]|nr:SDR family NAD(P)-dependent oxidoreductase [Acidimicrobiales bacterium]
MMRTVLVTGANSGVGRETVVHLAGMGFGVVGTARSEEKLEAIEKAARDAGVEVQGAVLDVTDEPGCAELVERTDPWAVVNNAGFMNVGRVVDVTRDEALRQLDTLVVGPMRLAALALPGMRRRGQGRIVNVSSTIAHATSVMTGWYQAGKHALDAVTDALRREVAGDGIYVVLIEPGGLNTRFWDKAADDIERRRAAAPTEYGRAERMLQATHGHMTDPARVAKAIGRALTAGRPAIRYRVGLDARVVPLLDRLLPDGVQDRIQRRVLGR